MVEVRLVGMYAGVVIGAAGESFLGFFGWEFCSSLQTDAFISVCRGLWDEEGTCDDDPRDRRQVEHNLAPWLPPPGRLLAGAEGRGGRGGARR